MAAFTLGYCRTASNYALKTAADSRRSSCAYLSIDYHLWPPRRYTTNGYRQRLAQAALLNAAKCWLDGRASARALKRKQ